MADKKLTELTEATEVDLTDQLYAVVGETSNRITVETLRNALDTLLADNNLSELGDASVARTNLGLGTAAEADIVGTVSQSGGDPTGAVIERGSNSNGEYVRYADGTQICWHRASMEIPSGSTVYDFDWDFPAPFVGDMPVSQASISMSFSDWTATGDREKAGPVTSDVGDKSPSNNRLARLFRIRPIAGQSFSEDNSISNCSFEAIGRWF